MSRINLYPETSKSNLSSDDYLVVDGDTNGTRRVKAREVAVFPDTSLSEEGKAADAKAVGDRLMSQKSISPFVNSDYEVDLNNVTTQGHYSLSATISNHTVTYFNLPPEIPNDPSNNHPYDGYYVLKVEKYYLKNTSNRQIMQTCFDAYRTSGQKIKIYYRIKGSTDWGNWHRLLRANDIDSTLSIEGAPADAKAVGDRFGTFESALEIINGSIETINDSIETIGIFDNVGSMVDVAETYFEEAFKPGTNFVYQQKNKTGLLSYPYPFYRYNSGSNTPVLPWVSGRTYYKYDSCEQNGIIYYCVADGSHTADENNRPGSNDAVWNVLYPKAYDNINYAINLIPVTACAELVCTLQKGIEFKNSRYGYKNEIVQYLNNLANTSELKNFWRGWNVPSSWEYDKTYSVGNWCSQNGRVYYCKKNHRSTNSDCPELLDISYWRPDYQYIVGKFCKIRTGKESFVVYRCKATHDSTDENRPKVSGVATYWDLVDSWVSGHQYSVGAVCVHSEKIYYCIKNNTASTENRPDVSGGEMYWTEWSKFSNWSRDKDSEYFKADDLDFQIEIFDYFNNVFSKYGIPEPEGLGTFDYETLGETDEDHGVAKKIEFLNFVFANTRCFKETIELNGVVYLNPIKSYLNNMGNKISPWAWYSDGSKKLTKNDYMGAISLAQYAQEHGFLKEMNENNTNISAGDLAFTGPSPDDAADDSSSHPPVDQLGHVVLVLHVGKLTKTVEVLESWRSKKGTVTASGDVCDEEVGLRTRRYSFSDIAYYATFPSGITRHAIKKIGHHDFNMESAAGERTEDLLLPRDGILNPFGRLSKGIYTFIIDGAFDTSPFTTWRVDATFAGSTSAPGFCKILESNNKYWLYYTNRESAGELPESSFSPWKRVNPWVSNHRYDEGDVCVRSINEWDEFEIKQKIIVYKCRTEHVSDVAKQPWASDGPDYWTIITGTPRHPYIGYRIRRGIRPSDTVAPKPWSAEIKHFVGDDRTGRFVCTCYVPYSETIDNVVYGLYGNIYISFDKNRDCTLNRLTVVKGYVGAGFEANAD